MNKDIKDRVFNLPDEVLNHLKYQITNGNGDIDGIKRARNLIETGTVTYGQLKRIIHDIKNIDKNNDISKYNLYGGDPMNNWGNLTLNNERDLIKSRKNSKKQSDNISSMNGERKNAFLKTHSKKSNILPSLNTFKSNSDSNSISSLKLSKLFEEIIKNI